MSSLPKQPEPAEEKLTEMIEDLDASVDELDSSVEELDNSIEQLTNKMGFWPTFFRGVIGALGAAIGGALVLGIIVYILQKLAGFPFIGELFQALLQQLLQNR